MNKNRYLILVALLLPLIFSPAGAQRSLTTDELFAQAQALSSEGQREQARNVCSVILERSPTYIDARVFLGRLYGWDGEYDKAREELMTAVEMRPDYTDARLALIDVELWSDNAELALRYADNGLAKDPDNTDLLARRLTALKKLGRFEEAMPVAERILEIDPDRDTVRRSYVGMLDETQLNKASADYTFVTFDDSTDNWHLASLAYRRVTGSAFGSVIGRLNLANRFDKSGAQIEVDAYPSLSRFWDRTYAYLNFGYSPSSLFPRFRYGGEVFHNYPNGWEGSLGFRFLDFENSNTMMYTGSVAKYIGDYWISLRPNYVPESSGDSLSAQLAVRKFFGSRYEYAEIRVGGGIEDEVVNFAGETQQLDSFRIRGELRRRIRNDLILKGRAGIGNEDFPNGRERGSIFLGIGIEKYY